MTTELMKPIGTGEALRTLLVNREDSLSGALERTGISPERFIAGVVQTVAKNERLLACTRESVLLACLEAAQIGLEPTGLLNQAWLVPYKTEARLSIGYGGYITLLDRAGTHDFIEANIVYEHDEFQWEKGTTPHILHVPASEGQRGRFGHANGGGYWVAWRKGSTRAQFDVMSFAEMEKRRKVSKRAEADMWRDWPEEMYRKTILRWGMKAMPLTPIIQRAMAYENANYDIADVSHEGQASGDGGRRGRLLDRIASPGSRDGSGDTEAPAEVSEAAKAPKAGGKAPGDGLPDLPEVQMTMDEADED